MNYIVPEDSSWEGFCNSQTYVIATQNQSSALQLQKLSTFYPKFIVSIIIIHEMNIKINYNDKANFINLYHHGVAPQ